ncbi:phosphoglycerate mutase [Persicimonas caeni]|uniref:Phosphoglycerate mutase n=1 Tax=Persicimonas caeni TaxID=2292766 RepID=A0A4Y6Q1L4_PERCE|nr:phosphoglycerate mutase [Persicimonas caeni]QDG54412.1 phosphoglycerate mutase [Persicimonas caeni]QED35633.1 phosphoglycerate mutase [Persicimonas caeni]
MERLRLLSELCFRNDSKILFWVFDGIGGVPHPDTGKTELETAQIPNLDAFARRASCGGLEAHGAGVAPGSGPGHLSLFGYPLEHFDLPRGVLEVLGAQQCYHNGKPCDDFALQPTDLAMRGNYATLERIGDRLVIGDRRANNIATESSDEVSRALSAGIDLDGYDVYIFPGKQHRFAAVIRGADLRSGLTDADPQRSGLSPRAVEAERPEAQHAADLVNEFVRQATEVLEAEPEANTVLLRGIGTPPSVPSLQELYGIKCAAIATYPMYRGIARLLGMDVLDVPSMSHEDQVKTLEENFNKHDFFYLHIKETDSVAHKGDFDAKVRIFEECDALFARALELDFDVVVVTGDHCTPSVLGDHSWHPIPTALWSKTVLSGQASALTERECLKGMLGRRASRDILPLALAEAGRLKKFGA